MERQARERNVREFRRALRDYQGHGEAREGLRSRHHFVQRLRARVPETYCPFQNPSFRAQRHRPQHRALRRHLQNGLPRRPQPPRDFRGARHRGAQGRRGC